MHSIILVSAILAVTAATPVYYEDHGYLHAPVYPVVHELSSAKSTLTKSSQVVNHGGTTVVHAPVYHVPVINELGSAKSTVKSSQVVNHGGTAVLHAPVHHVPVVHEIGSAKSTVTKSSQVVNHGGTALVHAPVYTYHPTHHVYEPHVYEPHVSYSPAVYSSVKTGDSAISHHSSSVHETEPVVNHYPLFSYHH